MSSDTRAAFTEPFRQLRNIIEEQTPGRVLSVNIFWSNDDSNARKLVLPADGSTPETNPETLQRLVADCDPASFGRGDQDVIDPEYRKAGKINTDQFATSFHPADFHILENLAQVLLPSVSNETDNQLVYSGPSGHFRKHVDTPRAANQIGSLVVCLPAAFTGGKLSVEHHGQKVEFDWSANSGTIIQWAAFYSDCKHEIETITQGDRITLTYNLYVTEPVGLPSPTSIVDPKTLPGYGWMKNLLEQGDSMKDGGVLGIFCSHAYAHSSKLADSQLPRALNGADLVLYSAFKSLGIDVEVLPVLENDGQYSGENSELGLTGRTQGRRRAFYVSYLDSWHAADSFEMFLKNGKKPLHLSYAEPLPSPASTAECEDGMADTFELAQSKKLAINENNIYKTPGTQIGISRFAYKSTDLGEEDDDPDDTLRNVWPVHYMTGITWITEPKHEEMAFSQIIYGNESSIGTRYSCAAILAVIPPSEKRAGIRLG
ncbi:hypothetical protein BDW62DRAFT_197372 [Aspergillus aurantiobrunneus]